MTGLKLLLSISMLWHTFAFAAGGVYIFHAYRVLFVGGYNPAGVRIIRTADWQLWLSGFSMIGLGLLIEGFDQYSHNPKLWAKVVVIFAWLISTQTIRQYAVKKLKTGNRVPMLLASSVNVSCWVYGAFLGVAKPIGLGVMSYGLLLIGFELVLALSIISTIFFECKYKT